MAVFVNILGNAPSYDNDAQRLVRSHVMKNYRQKERDAARQKWKAATKVMANMACGPESSQFILLDHGSRGTEEPRSPRGQVSLPSKPQDDILDSSQTHTECDGPISKLRHVSKPPKACDKRSKQRRRAIQPTYPDASESSTPIAQGRETYLTETIFDTVQSPELYRQQLMLPFLELHYSSSMPNLHLAFPKMRARLQTRQTSILTLATDAVLLHALSVSSKDDSLLWAARRRNNAAIAGLRSSLHTLRDNASDEMLLTTDALGFFDAGSSTAWRHHANGLAALIRARGPRIYDTLGVLLHAPVLQLLMDALLWRGPFVFGEAQWLGAMLPTCQTRMNRLLCLGCRVPDVVKRTERYLSEDESVREESDFDSLMDSLVALERSLQAWLSDWYLVEFQDNAPYTVTVTTAHTEPVNINLPTLLSPPPLPSTNTFPSLREAFAHNIFWTLLLIIRQAQHQLHTSFPSARDIGSGFAAQQTAANATLAADALVRTVPFILRNVASIPGGLACSAGPLVVAGRWYAVCDGEEERQCKEWCEEMVEVLTEAGERPAGWITRSCAAWITAAL